MILECLMFDPKRRQCFCVFHISVVAGALGNVYEFPYSNLVGASAGIYVLIGQAWAMCFFNTFCLDDASASRPDPPATTSVELLRVHSSLSQKSLGRLVEFWGCPKSWPRRPARAACQEIGKIACIFLDVATK